VAEWLLGFTSDTEVLSGTVLRNVGELHHVPEGSYTYCRKAAAGFEASMAVRILIVDSARFHTFCWVRRRGFTEVII
jgi:hypothetical protein